MSKKILLAVTVLIMSIYTANAIQLKPDIKVYRFGSNTQFLKPAVNKTTKNLIKNYKANPTDENLYDLKNQIEVNYDKAIAKKKAKLDKLEQKSTNQTKISEMREIVDIIERDKKNRIFWTLNRYTDNKLVNDAKASSDDFLPLYKAGLDVSIANSPVTNAKYAEFTADTGYKPPYEYSSDKEDYPVTNVSYYDALAYCNWLSKNDEASNYRLPTEKEWKLANISSKQVWEWTTTSKNSAFKIVKGLKSKKLFFRNRELKNSSLGYEDTGFRVIRVK